MTGSEYQRLEAISEELLFLRWGIKIGLDFDNPTTCFRAREAYREMTESDDWF